jgi:hypothetical protein
MKILEQIKRKLEQPVPTETITSEAVPNDDKVSVAEEVSFETTEPFVKEPGVFAVSNDELRYVGTYEVTDKSGIKWTINLNDDKSATMTAANSRTVYYAHWHKYYGGDCVQLVFDDLDPKVKFRSGTENASMPIVTTQYFYQSSISAKSQNPRRRLAITKIS